MDPLTLSARDLATAIRRREVSARELLDAHFLRIDELNPVVNAVVTQVRERAYAEACAADERTVALPPEELPPLHGIPMTHKDTHATAGIRTTSGSPLFADLVPTETELIVERFQQAGVISTGKNNVPEFAAGSHSYNPLFGVTRNPYDPSRSAGGSSGGAAVTVATRMQPLADGSDMGGSLRNPAAFNNVVGYRPSHAVVPAAPSRDPRGWLSQKGAMARSVDDVILGMSVIAGPDPRVPAPCPAGSADFAAVLDEPVGERPLTGVRIGVTTDFGLGVPVEPEVAAIVREEAEVFVELGATVEEAVPRLQEADRVFDATRAFEMALSLREVVARHRDRLKDEILWNVERGLALTAPDLMDVAIGRGRLDRDIARFFATYDVLLGPTSQLVPFPAEWAWPKEVAGAPMQTYIEWMRSATLISATGCPAVSVPGGFTGAGLPVGLQLVAAPARDMSLLRVARAYDLATRYADRAPDLPG